MTPASSSDERSPASAQRFALVGAVLLAVTLVALCWTTVLVVTGGVDLRSLGIRFSSRDPFRPACVAALLVLAYTAAFRSSARAHLRTLRSAIDRWGPPLVIVTSLYMCGVALRFGCSIAAGSDSYGYVSQADLWLAGNLAVPQPIAREMPWDTPEWTFAPLGYRPALSPGAIVPTYPPGLPILMALAKAVAGFCGPYLVVPLMGALLVWLTYRLGVRLASRPVGVAAAVLLAASPAFVGQLLRPMSDVPVATLLVAAVVVAIRVPRVRGASPGAEAGSSTASHPTRVASSAPLTPSASPHLWTGLLLSLALVVRPNLAPLAALFLAFAWLRERERNLRHRLAACAWLLAGLLPGVIAIAAIHTRLYGAPWKSGYGSLEGLYALRYAWPNLVSYPRWLVETQSLLIAACVIPLILWWRGLTVSAPGVSAPGVSASLRHDNSSDDARVLALDPSASASIRRVVAHGVTANPGLFASRAKAAWFAGTLIIAIWLSYLFYLPFDNWDYLRFVLAAIPLMLVLAIIGWQLAARRLRWESRAAVVLALFLVVLGYEVGRIQNLVILGRWKGECAEMNVAEFVSRHLPPNAVIVSMHFSGLLRQYAHRQTLRYDWLDPAWWPRALDVLTAKGYRPYIILIDWEEPTFRERFGLAAGASPDTAPLGTVIAQLGQPARVRIYDPVSAPTGQALTGQALTGQALSGQALTAQALTAQALTGQASTTGTPTAGASPNPVGTPTLLSPDAACPCTWRPGSYWQQP